MTELLLLLATYAGCALAGYYVAKRETLSETNKKYRESRDLYNRLRNLQRDLENSIRMKGHQLNPDGGFEEYRQDALSRGIVITSWTPPDLYESRLQEMEERLQ